VLTGEKTLKEILPTNPTGTERAGIRLRTGVKAQP
jgi:hypothetical protein